MSDDPIPPQTRIQIAKAGWLLDAPPVRLGKGGGGHVYKCYATSIAQGLPGLRLLNNYTGQQSADEAGCRLSNALYDDLIVNQNVVAVLKMVHNADARSEREVAFMERVRHPNLVRLLGRSVQTPCDWFVLSYCPNGPLESRAADFKGRILEVLARLRGPASALGALHEGGIVHRDVKPANIFITRDGQWVLGDLGISLDQDASRLTVAGPDMWSKEWVPDWVVDRPMDKHGPEMDIFMIAKTAYFLISGRKPRVTQMGEAEFDLRRLFPKEEAAGPVFEFLRSHLGVSLKDYPTKSGHEFVAKLDRLIAAFTGFRPSTLILSITTLHSITHMTSGDQARGMGHMALLPGGSTRVIGRIRSVGQTSVRVDLRDDGGTINGGYMTSVNLLAGGWSAPFQISFAPIADDRWITVDFLISAGADLTGAVLYASQ